MLHNSPPGTPHSSHSYQGTPSHSTLQSTRRTTGESLSCLVGASLTTVDNTIYVLGGFDRYSDEVFNTLYKLTVDGPQAYCWYRQVYSPRSPVLAKRNDHTATLWGTDKLVVFGGTGEEDDGEHYYNQVAILDLTTLTWEHPVTTGILPLGRIKHSASIDKDMLYISGGLDQPDHVADTVLVLNLQTSEWLEPLAFVPRSQHVTFIYNRRLYLFGGYHPDMSRSNVLAFLDLDVTDHVTLLEIDSVSAPPLSGEQFAQICGDQLVVVHEKTSPLHDDHSAINDRKGKETGLWTLDLTSMQWRYHPTRFFSAGQTFSMATNADRLYLFGNSTDDLDEYYTMVMEIDLKELGIVPVPPSQLGTDLGGLLSAGGSDFTLRSAQDPSRAIQTHRLVLLARWPHFAHLMNSGMVESFNGNSLTLPEPLDVIDGFVRFLYTDTLDEKEDPNRVADLMVMANLYLLPRLVALCVRRLYGWIYVDTCAKIHVAAVDAGQDALAQVALAFCFRWFGKVVKTNGFRSLPSVAMARLLDQVPFFATLGIRQDDDD